MLSLMLLIVAAVAFAAAAGLGPAFEPYRGRCVAFGLFCWALSALFPGKV